MQRQTGLVASRGLGGDSWKHKWGGCEWLGEKEDGKMLVRV